MSPKWICIAIPSNLNYWNLHPEDHAWIQGIDGVYFYDANEQTHCCEITPSYFLRALRYSVRVHSDCPEQVREQIWERYEAEYPEDCYMHCSVVDNMKVPKVEWGQCSEDTTEENVREYWQSNHVV